MIKTMLSIIFYFYVVVANASTHTEVVLPPTTYQISSTSGSQTFNVSFTRTQTQLMDNYAYSMNMKNADGVEHPVSTARDCSELIQSEKTACLAQRASNLTYINNVRVKEALSVINSAQITSKTNFNRDTAQLSVPISNLALENNLQITLKGAQGAFVEVGLSVIVTNIDDLPPTVTSSISNGTVTNIQDFHISITDASETVTEVYKEGQLILTSPLKDISLNLSEGSNNYLIKSRDEFNNVANDFIIQNVTLDTVKPIINSNVKAKYFLQTVPGSINFEFYAMEPLSSILLNGSPVNIDSSTGIYLISPAIIQPGSLSYQLQATDLAGNETDINFSVDVGVDNVAPSITLGQVPLIIITDSFLLPVSIVDENETVTSISVDGVLVGPFNDKQFSYLIDFPADGTKVVVVTAIDAANNQSQQTISITKNTGPLLAEVISPLNNTTLNTHNFEVQLSSNKPIKEVIVNGITYPSTSGLTIKVPVQINNDGTYNFPIQITDIFDEKITITPRYQISTNSVNSWNYQDCPVE